MIKTISTNDVTISGIINSKFEFSHEVYGEGFYKFTIKTIRFSGVEDFIPMIISERRININKKYIGDYVEVKGHFRSFNKWENNVSHLVLYVFVKQISWCDEERQDENIIKLNGFIVKPVKYRKTPLGRKISDIMLAANRPYGKSDYIPCIAWGRDAIWSTLYNVGEQIKLTGRIQSRLYRKTTDAGIEERTAYEVSIRSFE